MAASLVALCCPTADRDETTLRGARVLAEMIGEQIGVPPRIVGSPGVDPGGCLLEAGGQISDALGAAAFPLLVAGDGAIGASTLPAVADHRPDALVLWLEGRGRVEWKIAPERVVLAGVRDLEEPARAALEKSPVTVIGASPIETLVAVKNALDGAPVYVHVDLDVIGDGGLKPEKLYDVLEAVAADCEVVGAEVTGFAAPADDLELRAAASTALHVLEPLLNAIPEETNVEH